MDQNRRFAELAGIDPTFDPDHICPRCGYYCTKRHFDCCPPIPIYPDFAAEPGRVLEAMDKIDQKNNTHPDERVINSISCGYYEMIPYSMIKDRTGKLRDAASEFMEERMENNAI